MRSSIIQISAIVLLLSINLSSCKKYPEDEKLSLKTAKSRLSNDWIINEMYVNDSLVTSSWSYSPGFNFTKKGIVIQTFGDGKSKEGTWEFWERDKSMIELTFTNVTTVKQSYEILKLTKEELKLKYQYNSNTDVLVITYAKI